VEIGALADQPSPQRGPGAQNPDVDLDAFARSRWDVLRPSFWRILQAAFAAAAAWSLARLIPHHPRPFFAPVAAVVAMGAVPGTRGRQAYELIFGVALGIGVAGLVVLAAGSGTWQLGLAAALAMACAITVSDRPVVRNQAAVSAVLLIALHRPGAAPGRLIDALVGGGVAILVAQVLLPIDPLKLVRAAARSFGDELARVLDGVAEALRTQDVDAARRALTHVEGLDGRRLDDALTIARGVVRRAPRRRWEARAVAAYGEFAHELHVIAADGRALASGALRALRDGTRPVPPGAATAASALASALRSPTTVEVEADCGRARAAARLALAEAPSLGMNVFAHAVEAIADHAARASAAVADARARNRQRVLRLRR
jgi:hypothetical protein